MKNNPIEFKIDVNKVYEALLEKKDRINVYFDIMKLVNQVNVKEEHDFQKKFNYFYKIMKKKKEFYDSYYYYLEENKEKNIKYEEILEYFYKKFGVIEKSFSSKLLATINPNMPVWDSIVLNRLGMKAPSIYAKNRFENTVKMYYEIVQWYKEYLVTDNAKEVIIIFDKVFPNNRTTDIKKIDLVLWSIR